MASFIDNSTSAALSDAELDVRVEPNEMFQYLYTVMNTSSADAQANIPAAVAQQQWGAKSPIARSAALRCGALHRALTDQRVHTWTTAISGSQIYIPSALMAAAGIAQLTVAEDHVAFDIPNLLDATLRLSEPAGHA